MTDKKEMSAAERGALANIPASALADMVKVGSADPMADRAAYAIATGGPCGMIPADYSRQATSNRPNPPASATPGWQAEIPLQPQPGIDLIDRMVENATARERAQAQQPDMWQVAAMMMQSMVQQNQILLQIVSKLQDQAAEKAEAKDSGADTTAATDKPKAKGKS
jgi:hypothetical protein